MANRVTPLTNVETLSGNISAATYFDNNISPAFTALNDASLGYVNGVLADTGSANNYIVAAAFGTPSLANNGMTVAFNPANSNTGASTLTFSPLTSAAIVRPDGTALIGGEIVATVTTTAVYDGTKFRIVALPWMSVVKNLGSITANQTVNCQNASSITVSFVMNTTTALTISLTNVAAGVPVTLFCSGNTSGGTATFFPTASHSGGGGAYTSFFIQQGVAGSQTGFVVSASKILYASGNNDGGTFYLTGVQSL